MGAILEAACLWNFAQSHSIILPLSSLPPDLVRYNLISRVSVGYYYDF